MVQIHLEKVTPQVIEFWNYILRSVGAASSKLCFIGGGSIRDLLLNKPIRDVDVFYEGILNKKKLHEILGGPELKQRDMMDHCYDRHALVIHDWAGEINGEWVALNLVEVSSIEYRKQSFAASISTVFYSIPLGLQIMPSFLETAHTKEIKFYETATGYYYNKIAEKFPKTEGWTYHGNIADDINETEGWTYHGNIADDINEIGLWPK